jgi:formylglycine-generating enzyme required for sulfatase activity/energy-coupling factor transporter ATP-binding protein EcfA2
MAKAPLRRVFLSSTGRDLHEYREVVAAAINKVDGFHCVRMEDFGARDRTPREHCRLAVETCDVYVGLFGRLYGSLVPGEKFSFTEMEYDTAVELDLPRLLFFAEEGFPMSESLWKDAQKGIKARDRFHARAREDRLAGRFGFGTAAPEQLAKDVAIALGNLVFEKKGAAPKRRKVPAASSPDLAAVERTYLAFLADRYQYLDFKGMGVSGLTVRFPLLDLYVPLKARPALPEGDRTGMSDLRLAGKRMTDEERAEAGSLGQPAPVLDLLQKERGLVLLGDPGAGKSTFLKALALLLAAGRGDELGLAGRVPFLVPIAGYAETLSKGSARLDHFIASDFKERVSDLDVGGLLASALAAGRALILLDGLDEVRERSLQQKVVARVQDFFSLHAQPGNKFVVTSRLVGYREVRPTAQGLVEATLLDFEDEEIEVFLSKWLAVQERTVLGNTQAAAGSAERQRRELAEALERNPTVRSLAANPLLLTILALMKRQGVTLPEQRAKLYDTYVRTLLETWNTVRSLRDVPVVERSAADLLKVLAPLALWIHESSPGVGLVRRSELLRQLERIYREERGLAYPEAAKVAAEAFLRDVNESCLLLERGNGLYGFLHLTFLEYLAGYALAKLDQQGTGALLGAIAPRMGEPTWREVLLLAIGHLGAVEEREVSAGAVLQGLVEMRPGAPGEAEELAGRALADLGPTGARPEVRETLAEALMVAMRDDARVPAPQRAAVGEALAAIGDPRPEVTTVAGMKFCWVPPGKFAMGSSEEDEEADGDEKPQHEVEIPYGYWVGRYPVTTAQYREYCEAAQVLPGHVDCLRGLATGPVGWVSWHEACRLCHWLSEKGRREGWLPEEWKVTLPSEAEWEKAARGGARLPAQEKTAGWAELAEGGPGATLPNPSPARAYPWVGGADPNRSSYDETGLGKPSAVGCFPGGVSPVGCEELSGNVWEWTQSRYEKYPYLPSDGRESEDLPEGALVVLRGGSCVDDARDARCASRSRDGPLDRGDDIGFRVVVRPFFPDP